MPYRNIKLHPFLRLIYLLIRVISWFGIGVFYRKRLVLGKENFKFDGPAIVIVNHPSTMMDVLNPGIAIRQEMFFLANYSLFKNPVSAWLLNRLFCIPVKRAEDVSPGEQRDNTDAFLQSYEHLEQYGVLFIAPEGTSWMNRFVRPLKTGTARIALGAEDRNNWLLGLKIIPVGHSYTAPHLFRSEVVVQAGKPIVVADWADQYRENQVAAVDDLTEHLEQQLKSLSIHTRDEAGEAMITQLEEILKNESSLSQRESFYRSQSLAARFLDDHVLANLLEDYQDSLKKQGLSDAAICFSNKRAPWWLLPALMAGLPFFLLGYLLWWLPCFVPAWITKRMNLYVGYGAIAKILLGLFTFPLAMWGVYHLGKWLGGQAWFGVVAVLLMVVLGYFTEKYLDWWQRFRNHAAGAALHRHHQQEWAAAQRARESLLSYIA